MVLFNDRFCLLLCVACCLVFVVVCCLLFVCCLVRGLFDDMFSLCVICRLFVACSCVLHVLGVRMCCLSVVLFLVYVMLFIVVLFILICV